MAAFTNNGFLIVTQKKFVGVAAFADSSDLLFRVFSLLGLIMKYFSHMQS